MSKESVGLLKEVKVELHLFLLKQSQGAGFHIPWLYGGNSQDIVEAIVSVVLSKTASLVQVEATAYYAEMMKEAIERLRVKKDAECQQKIEEVLKLLPEIPVRYSHNATCFDCVNNIRLKALKSRELKEGNEKKEANA